MNHNERLGTLIMAVIERLKRDHAECTLTLKSDHWLISWENGPSKRTLSETIRAALPEEGPRLSVKLERTYSSPFLCAVRSTAAYVTQDEEYGRVDFDSAGFRTRYHSLAELLQKFIEDTDASLFMRLGPVNRANLMDQALPILQSPEEPEQDPDLAREKAAFDEILDELPADLFEAIE